MKKRSTRILIWILAALLLFGLSACAKKPELPGLAPVGTEAYWARVAGMMADGLAAKDGKAGVTLQGKVDILGELSLLASFGYDLEKPDDSVFAVKLYDATQNKLFFKANNDNTYVDIAQNDFVGDARLKLTDTNIFSLLNLSYSAENYAAAEARLLDILKAAGEFLFQKVDVNAASTEYAFTFYTDFTTRESVKRLAALLDKLDADTMQTVFYMLDIRTAEELAAQLPALGGSVCFRADGGRITQILTDGMTLDGLPLAFDITVTNGYVSAAEIEAAFPVDDQGYLVTAVGNLAADGTAALLTSAGNKQAIKYDFELNMNIDYIRLLAAEYDLTALPEDNYFHFRLSHKCDNTCTEFCRSKLQYEKGGSEGAVLDIAFSPSDFGNANFFIVTNIKHLLGKEYLASINKYPLDITIATLTDYCLFTVPAQALREDSALKTILTMLCTDLMFRTGRYEIDLAKIIALLPENGLAAEIFTHFLKSDEYDNDVLKMKIDTSWFGQSSHYDIYTQAVCVIDSAVAAEKSFYHPSLGVVMGLNYGALDYAVEEAQTADGMLLHNIYSESGTIIHGVENGAYVPMSALEAAGLAGSYLMGSYTNFEKQTVDNVRFEIVGVEKINYANKGVQEAVLRIRYPSPLDYLYFGKLFEGYGNSFTVPVAVRIKLTEETNFTFVQSVSPNAVFELTYQTTAIPAFLQGEMILSYADGRQKTIVAEGVSDAVTVGWTSLPGLGTKRYSIQDWGKITVRFAAANREIIKTYLVKTPDTLVYEIDESRIASPIVGDSVFTSTITAGARLYAYYGDTRVQVLLSPADFTINGIGLRQNASYWESHPSILTGIDRLVFFAANDYAVRIVKHGELSRVFTLRVRAKQDS